MTLVETLARYLRDRFDALAELFIPPLLRLCTRANKVFVTCAHNTLKSLIEYAGVQSIVPLLLESMSSPSKTLRTCSAECLFHVLQVNSEQKLENYVEAIESMIRQGSIDQISDVRSMSKKSFDLYKAKFPNRLTKYYFTYFFLNTFNLHDIDLIQASATLQLNI
jgi:hypothetical protein